MLIQRNIWFVGKRLSNVGGNEVVVCRGTLSKTILYIV
jgi:hypothetical protein